MSEIIVAIPSTGCPKLDRDVQQWVDENAIPTVVTEPKLQAEINKWGVPWYRAAAVVVNDKKQILMMHEGMVRVMQSH